MPKVLVLMVVFFLASISAACQPGPQPTGTQVRSSPTLPGSSSNISVPESQRKWEETLSLARKEGLVTAYTGPLTPSLREVLTARFEEKYQIRLEFVVVPAGIPVKWEREKNAGLNLADVFLVGGATVILTMKPKGALGLVEPYFVLPEVKDPRGWPDGKLRFLDADKTALPLTSAWTSYVVINTELVKEGQLTSYKDLLKPEWKGKVALYNPSIVGAGAGWATFMITDAFGPDGGKEFLRQFAATQPAHTSDVRQLVEWVARGKYAIGVGASHAFVSEFKAQGAPVTLNRFIEGGNINPGSGVLYVSATPAHPNATTVFINWLLTAEGQAVYARGDGSPPVRLDAKVEGIDPIKIARPGDKVFWTDEKFFMTQVEAQRLAKEIFGL